MKNLSTKLILTLTAGMLIAMLTGCSDSSTSPTSSILPGDDEGTRDTSAPAPVTGLMATSGGSVVKLMWEANTLDADLEGYLVYRSFDGMTWALTDAPILDNRFVDTEPLPRACLYSVSAVDGAGNESALAQFYLDMVIDRPEIEETVVDPR